VASQAAKLGLELRLQRDAESIKALRRRVADLEVSYDNSAGARLRHDQIRMVRTRVTVLEAEVDLLKRIGAEKDAQLKEYGDVHGYYADRLAKVPGMKNERDEARREVRRAHDEIRLLKKQLTDAGFNAWELGGDAGGPFAELHAPLRASASANKGSLARSPSPRRIGGGYDAPEDTSAPRAPRSPPRMAPLDTGRHKSPKSRPQSRPGRPKSRPQVRMGNPTSRLQSSPGRPKEDMGWEEMTFHSPSRPTAPGSLERPTPRPHSSPGRPNEELGWGEVASHL